MTKRALIPGFLLCYGFILFFDLRYSAIDLADPASQLEQARLLASNGSGRDIPVLIQPPFLVQSAPKPLFDLFLALGIRLGIPPSAAYYHAFARIFALAFFLFSLLVVQKKWGPLCAFFYGSFFVTSNTGLQHILHGGHIWTGQAFLWSALLLSLRGSAPFCHCEEAASAADEAISKDHSALPWSKFLISTLLIASVLSSHYMYPFAGLLMLCAILGEFKVKNYNYPGPSAFVTPAQAGVQASWRNWIPAFAGMTPVSFSRLGLLTAPWLVFLTLGFSFGYFQHLTANLAAAGQSAGIYPAGREYFLNFLFTNESLIYFSVIFFAAMGGVVALARKAPEDFPALVYFVILPLFVFLFFERPGALKLGRIYVTLLPFILILASIALTHAAYSPSSHVPFAPSPLVGEGRVRGHFFCAHDLWAVALIAILGFSNCPLLTRTWRAFHAGKYLETILKNQFSAGADDLVVIGMQSPFRYVTWSPPENRTNIRARVLARAKEGKKTALISQFSNWNWLGFMNEEESSILPVRRVYQSLFPYAEIPSVEALPFYLFINEGIYFQWRKGKIVRGVPNRLYKMEDFLKALR